MLFASAAEIISAVPNPVVFLPIKDEPAISANLAGVIALSCNLSVIIAPVSKSADPIVPSKIMLVVTFPVPIEDSPELVRLISPVTICGVATPSAFPI